MERYGLSGKKWLGILTHHPIKNILITLSCIYIIFWGRYNQRVPVIHDVLTNLLEKRKQLPLLQNYFMQITVNK